MNWFSDYEIQEIKQNGKLIAYSAFWGYWLYDGTVYSIPTAENRGANTCFFCSVGEMSKHLHRLWQVTGKRMFTENPNVTVADSDFLSQFYYA